MDISSFIDRWRQSAASERANKDSFLRDLCDVLGVPHPDPATGNPERDRYVFERDVVLPHAGEKQTIGKIDLYKHGCFILEAKQGSEAESKKIGSARRGTPSWNIAMTEAYGQAVGYASTIEPAPPFLIITDIGECFDLYACFDGSRRYQKFPDALSARIHLSKLAEPQNLETLRTIFTEPYSLDPSKRAAKVTREIAMHLANLAKSLNEAGHTPELVAKFLMRCLFTMFAEDVELLPKGIFADALKNRWIENPDAFPGEVEDLWRRMNEGGYLFGAGNIWQFNGGLFAEPVALPLNNHQLFILGLAAASNWADVEPAIFGTLLERALDPRERHRLGAHYTPRAYVERLVRPTIEEPLRAEWDNVRAQVIRLIADSDGNLKVVAEARKIVETFYDRLTRIRVLDPACGSGNFLFVALDLFKRLENEVIDLLESLGRDRSLITFGRMVTPEQFLGIEIKPWAKEITELVLWIGWLQWQIRTRGYKSHPQEPILRDYHNIECRDAVLAYDAKELLLGDDGNSLTRWDGVSMKLSPVTGEEIPDDTARVPVYRYLSPKKAKWPEADFVVGNPPYIGIRRIRASLGDAYVEALREAYRELPETVDLVMYWWHSAADLVDAARLRAFGFITTNSIVQSYSRPVIESHLDRGSRIAFAIPDHPWVDSADGADVRVAMTVVQHKDTITNAILCSVASEAAGDEESQVQLECTSGSEISASLTVGANTRGLAALRANVGMCYQGVVPAGDGFKLAAKVGRGLRASPENTEVVRPYVIGKDLVQRPEERYIIDLFGYSEDDVRRRWPAIYQHVRDYVYDIRSKNNRAAYRDKWWLFAEPRPALRSATVGLRRYIGTPYTAKYRPFVFIDTSTVPDAMVYVIPSDDAFFVGALSSRVHALWALSSGGRLGIGNDPRYTSKATFLPFPFPGSDESTKQRIRELGEQLDAHRKRRQQLSPGLTITGMYNVLEKLRSGEPLTPKERVIHDEGLISVLKQIHDDLDAAVVDAYGWPHDLSDQQILERLVALNAARAEEERRGVVHWLRPEFQRTVGKAVQEQQAIGIEVDASETAEAAPVAPVLWPKKLPLQIAAVRDLVTIAVPSRSWTAKAAAAAFRGARGRDVAPILDSLAALGILVAFDTSDGRYWRGA